MTLFNALLALISLGPAVTIARSGDTAAIVEQPTEHPSLAPLQGRLGNGLRYVIVSRRANEPGVSLFMQVKGGFIAERRPGERGLAHLIEHLAFHSPTRSAPDDAQRFRSVGLPLTFREPAGGTTTWRESDYYVVSSTTRLADIDALLGLYREVASELIFRPEAVDEQRAAVMREMAEKRLGNVMAARHIAAVAPGSPNDLIDTQNSDDVPTATIETIRALYERLYRPENTSLVIVGDINAQEIAALIERRFGDWRGAEPRVEQAPIPTVRPEQIAPVSHSALPEVRRAALITVTSPLPPPAPTRQQQIEALLWDMLAMRAVNERLAQTQTAGAPGKYGVFIENGEQGHRLIMVWDNFEPGQGRSAVSGLARATCSLRSNGLSELEWTRARQQVLHELEGRAMYMTNFEMARQLADDIAVGRDAIPPAELLHHARDWLPTIEAHDMNDWWRRQWREGVQHVRVEAPELAVLQDPNRAILGTAGSATFGSGCFQS